MKQTNKSVSSNKISDNAKKINDKAMNQNLGGATV